jgi:elongation factor P
MRFEAGAHLQGRRLDLDEPVLAEETAHCCQHPAARHEPAMLLGEPLRLPPGRSHRAIAPLIRRLAHSAFPAVCQLVGSAPDPHFDTPQNADPIAMPKINAIDLKPGNVLEHQNKLWIVVKRELVQPGKGGAFAQVELRDLRSGSKVNERFRTQETVERVRLDEKDMQFLYMEGDQATFMDSDTFEQVSVPRELIGDPADFLHDGMICQVMLYEGTPLSIEIPPTVTMAVVEADPVVRGQTASSSYKPGRLENGRRVMIPPHIEAGTRIVVNTADASYVERAKD